MIDEFSHCQRYWSVSIYETYPRANFGKSKYSLFKIYVILYSILPGSNYPKTFLLLLYLLSEIIVKVWREFKYISCWAGAYRESHEGGRLKRGRRIWRKIAFLVKSLSNKLQRAGWGGGVKSRM